MQTELTSPANSRFRIAAQMRLLAAGSLLALAAAQPLGAQSSQRGFSLPEPSPTPTAAPQGPADERSGVQIGPRVIRPPVAQPTPAPTPAPTPTRTAAPAPTPTPAASQPRSTPTPTATRAPTRSPSRTTERSTQPASRPARATPSPTPTPAPAESFEPLEGDISAPSGASIPLGDSAGPGFDSIPEEDELLPEADADGWYDVTGTTGDGAQGSDTTAPGSNASDFAALQEAARRNGLLIGIAVMLLLGAALAFLVWRRRREEKEQLAEEVRDFTLARGVSRTIREQMNQSVADIAGDDDEVAEQVEDEAQEEAAAEPVAAPTPEPEPDIAPSPVAPPIVQPEPDIEIEPEAIAEPEPEPEPELETSSSVSPPAFIPREPARLDLGLEIVNATRSLMMFTVDFRLDVANRSDHAVRDLTIAGRLACAQRSGETAAATQPITTIERIGPNQSGRVSGQLQLPLGEVQAIRQGAKPLFIPLMHVAIEGPNQPATQVSYVIGSPSAASQGRVHPLPLDGPPGSLQNLRAQMIRAPLGGDTKAAEPA